MREDIPGAGLLHVTSADRLDADWRRRGRAGTAAGLLAPLAADAALVTVLDGHPATLSWLGAVLGHRVRALGVDRFGQSAGPARPLPRARARRRRASWTPAPRPCCAPDRRPRVSGARQDQREPRAMRRQRQSSAADLAGEQLDQPQAHRLRPGSGVIGDEADAVVADLQADASAVSASVTTISPRRRRRKACLKALETTSLTISARGVADVERQRHGLGDLDPAADRSRSVRRCGRGRRRWSGPAGRRRTSRTSVG